MKEKETQPKEYELLILTILTCFTIFRNDDPYLLPLSLPLRLVLVAPTTNQAVTKQVARAEASGGVVGDIRIDNFDIAFGNK